MSDINVRSESVDVEQIMRQIRARIREKRGADYTDAELQQLAGVKLRQFLDPRGVRSDLVERFRKPEPPPAAMPQYVFEDTTIFETHRGVLRVLRNLLRPVLKLFFNPNKLSDALHLQVRINQEVQALREQLWQRGQLEPLYYEVMHNLVVELTRLGIEVQNLKMRVESLTSRLDFDERRGRALESVVEYRPALARRGGGRPADAAPAEGAGPAAGGSAPGDAPGDAERRRRRRRRRRRPGQTAADAARPAGSGGEPVGTDRGEATTATSEPAAPEDPERDGGPNDNGAPDQ